MRSNISAWVWVIAAVPLGVLRVPAQVTNAPSVTSLTRAGGRSELVWGLSATGMHYTVQRQDRLEDGLWRLAESDVSFPMSTNRWVSTADGGDSGFYRVVAVPSAERGKVISVSVLGTLPTNVLTDFFRDAGIPLVPQYPVRLHSVVCESITPLGARTTASGALALPEGVGGSLPLVSYQHGTITETNRAPSSLDVRGEVTIGIAFASSGYAAAVPDYLGLGASPGLHPYHHARSQATACLDFLRAAKSVCASGGFPLSGRLFLCGYSQGGHATMALLRELETYHTNEFTVTACAPMAGAYDLSGTTAQDFLSDRPKPNPYYFLYLLAAYQEVYRFAPTLAELLASPHDVNLPPLLKGNSSGGQINTAMPPNPIEILKPELLAAFESNPRHPLRLALRDNDLLRWKPRSPLRLYHCSGDQDVIAANSQAAYASFRALGATQVQIEDPRPGASHGDCAQPSLLRAKAWFDSLQ